VNKIRKCDSCGFEADATYCPFCHGSMWTDEDKTLIKKAYNLIEKWGKYYDDNYETLKHNTHGMVNMAEEEECALYPDIGPNPIFRYMHRNEFVNIKINAYRGKLKPYLVMLNKDNLDSIRSMMK